MTSDDDPYLLGIQAYKQKQYAEALQRLATAPDDQWDAQLYLGMSLYMLGRLADARTHFARMRDECPDPELRDKAIAAFAAVNSKIMQAVKNKKDEKKAEDELTIEW